MANGSFVDRIVASGASRGTAYVTFEHHRSGVLTPYIFRTTDFGKSWKLVTTGLPNGAPVRSIAEYPGKANVLFAGTERFVYFTTDSGAKWTRVTGNLPTTRYDEIVVHPRTKDIVFGTHGRSIWVLDDASPFAEWTAAVAAKPAHLFSVRRATLINYWADVSTAAHGIYAAENPVEGAVFSYHLARAAQSVKFTVTNASKRVIRELTGPLAAGIVHRVNWDLRYPPAAGGFAGFGGGGEESGGPPPAAPVAPVAPGGQGGGRANAPRVALPVPAHNIGARGFYVSPGTYTVTMEVDGEKSTRTFDVRADPTMMETLADHQAREAFLLDVQDVQTKLEVPTATFRTRLAAATGADAVRMNALAQKLGLAGGAGRGGRGGRGGGGPAATLAGLAGAWNGSGARHGGLQAPSATQRAVLADAKKALIEIEKELVRK